MEDNKIIKLAAIGFIGLFVIPMSIRGITKTIVYAANGINNLAYKRKIKKGKKDGSIIEIDGQYYKVEITD